MKKPELSRSVNCFGLQWIDQDNHIYKITHEEEYITASFKDMKQSGIEAVELSTLGPWNHQEELENYPFVERACEIIQDCGLTLNSVHLPFACQLWNFTSLDETERKLSVESVKRAVSHYEKHMPNLFVMHPDSRPKTPSERPQRLEQLIKSMDEICDFAPAKICIENLTNDSMLNVSSEAKVVLDAVPKLYMTIDINHPLTQMPEDYILDIAGRIKNVHVSDRDHEKERHFLPGKGVLDWDKIMSALKSVNYDGMLTYEVSKKIPASEIKQNYEWLMTKWK